MQKNFGKMIICLFPFVMLLAGCSFRIGGNIDIFEVFEEDDIENYEEVFEDTDLNTMATSESHSIRNGDGSYQFTIDGEEYEFKVTDYYIVRVYDEDREKIWVMESSEEEDDRHDRNEYEEESHNGRDGEDDAENRNNGNGDRDIDDAGSEEGSNGRNDNAGGNNDRNGNDNQNNARQNEADVIGTISSDELNVMLEELYDLFTSGIRMDCRNINGYDGVIMLAGDDVYSKVDGQMMFYLYGDYIYMEDNGQWYFTEAPGDFSADIIRSQLGFENVVERFGEEYRDWDVVLLTVNQNQYKCIQSAGSALLFDDEMSRIVGLFSRDRDSSIMFTPIDGIELPEECEDAIYEPIEN